MKMVKDDTLLHRRTLSVGDYVESGEVVPIKLVNTLPMRNIPMGSVIHCIELKIGKGAQIARSAGTSAQLLAKEGRHVTIRLRSGEMRKILSECRATLGEVSNSEHNLRSFGKAGARGGEVCDRRSEGL